MDRKKAKNTTVTEAEICIQNESDWLPIVINIASICNFASTLTLMITSFLLVFRIIKLAQSRRKSLTQSITMKQAKSLSITVAVTAYIHLILTVPLYIHYLINKAEESDLETGLNCLATTNHAINLFFYCLTSPKYRSEVKKLLGIDKPETRTIRETIQIATISINIDS